MDKKDVKTKNRNEDLAGLVRLFLLARTRFDEIQEKFKDKKQIYQELEDYVRKDAKMVGWYDYGLLTKLYERSNSLYGSNNVTEVEKEFNLKIRLLFNEIASLREERNIVEEEGQIEKSLEGEVGGEKYERKALKIDRGIIERTGKKAAAGFKESSDLFKRATEKLEKMLPIYANNPLIPRVLLENQELVEKIYGKEGINKIFEAMYENGLKEAYLVSANSYLKSGFCKEAALYFENLFKLTPEDKLKDVYVVVANSHLDMGFYEEAALYFENLFKLTPEDKLVEFCVLLCGGMVQYNQKEHGEAEDRFKMALELIDNVRDEKKKTEYLGKIRNAFFEMGKVYRKEDYHKDAEEVTETGFKISERIRGMVFSEKF